MTLSTSHDSTSKNHQFVHYECIPFVFFGACGALKIDENLLFLHYRTHTLRIFRPPYARRKSSKFTKSIKIEFRALSGLRSQVSTLNLSLSTSHSLLFITLREHGRSFIGGGGCHLQTPSFFVGISHVLTRTSHPLQLSS